MVLKWIQFKLTSEQYERRIWESDDIDWNQHLAYQLPKGCELFYHKDPNDDECFYLSLGVPDLNDIYVISKLSSQDREYGKLARALSGKKEDAKLWYLIK